MDLGKGQKMQHIDKWIASNRRCIFAPDAAEAFDLVEALERRLFDEPDLLRDILERFVDFVGVLEVRPPAVERPDRSAESAAGPVNFADGRLEHSELRDSLSLGEREQLLPRQAQTAVHQVRRKLEDEVGQRPKQLASLCISGRFQLGISMLPGRQSSRLTARVLLGSFAPQTPPMNCLMIGPWCRSSSVPSIGTNHLSGSYAKSPKMTSSSAKSVAWRPFESS